MLLRIPAYLRALIVLAVWPMCCVQARELTLPLAFQGSKIVSVSDADMLASAYGNGLLGPEEGSDALSVIDLQARPIELKAAEVTVSNSVIGPPAVLAVSPGGQYAVVVESMGARKPGEDGQTLRDLPQGDRITVVDIKDASKPTVIQTVRGPVHPDSISFNAQGDLLVVAVSPQGSGREQPLVFYPFSDGRLGAMIAVTVPNWSPGDRLISAAFHPRTNMIAVVNSSKAELSFFRVERTNAAIELKSWGDVVKIEKGPYVARFTPDGTHIVVSATYLDAVPLAKGLGLPRGTMMSIRTQAQVDPDGSPRHVVVSRIETGVGPEGLAISPDGKLAVALNLERTPLPSSDPRRTFYASLTLARLDPQSGTLSKVGDFAFDGVLPEAAVFDNSSRFLAVTNFNNSEGDRKGGSIDFWRVASDPLDLNRLSLVKTPFSVQVSRGPHAMILVP